MMLLRVLCVLACMTGAAMGGELRETPSLADKVASGALPPIIDRAPLDAKIVDLAAKGREPGEHGGRMRMMVTRAKDIRLMVVYGYARLAGYDETYQITPDLLRDIEVRDGRIFTLHLRRGHKWSDGHPFTAEDFRYWWEDVAQNLELSPSGPSDTMMVEGEIAQFTIIDDVTVQYEWSKPNPRFLSALAAASPLFIYRPAHFLKNYHADYADPEALAEAIEKKKKRSWAQLHNKLDNLYKFDNPDLPTLQPWVNTTAKNGRRYVLHRNPYFHRIDSQGRQLPYIDSIEVTVAAAGLIPAKVKAGDADLQVRGLGFGDISTLKRGEEEGDYRTLLWETGAASHIALYPNQTYKDPGWREVLRDVRFRRALSLAVDRAMINRSLYFGLAREVAMAPLEASPFHDPAYSNAYSAYDPDEANRLLDEMGLTERRGDGVRLLPDGRPMEVIVETAGERAEEVDALELVGETWREIGVKLVARPLDRDILRNRAYAGRSMMPVWSGWNNGVPTPDASPKELAPVDQSSFCWPAWGQHYQTKGQAGAPPDTGPSRQLLVLFHDWSDAGTEAERAAIWREMLRIHSENVFAIGLVSAAPQPLTVSNRLRNMTDAGLYVWDPGAHLGIYRIDELFFAGTGG